MSKRLLELATVRSEKVTIAGETLTVTEPSALQLIERNSRMRAPEELDDQGKPKPRKLLDNAQELGLAYLISVCVKDESGHPSWTEEEALTIATGRNEVALPIINAITGFIGREKKASPIASDSSTA